jgi:uncharacterized protein (TIGR00369 family)
MTTEIEGNARLDPRAYLKHLFDASPFHQQIGFELVEIGYERLAVRVQNIAALRSGKGNLHGGVIASLVDAVGSFHAGVAVQQRAQASADASEGKRAHRIATIDLHVDYLRPLLAEHFIAATTILHTGASTVRLRAEVRADDGELVAVASANYSY